MSKSLAIKKITKSKSRNLMKRSQQVTRLLRQQWERFRRSRVKGQRKTKRNREQRKRLRVKPKQQAQGLSPKKPVSKPLLDTLWAKFKLRKGPKVQDYFSLSFEFSLTDKQVYLWFREKKKKYKEEMAKQKNRRNSWSEVLQACCADLRDEDTADLKDVDVADSRDEDVADPRDKDTADPRDEDVADPRDEDTADPRDEDTADPRDEDTADPRDEDMADLRDEDTADPREEDTADPRDEDVADLRGEDVADPRDEDVAEGMNS